MLVRVDHIPICMMASKNKDKLQGIVQDRVKYAMTGHCADRCFERLPGYIDVTVLSMDNCKSLLPRSSSTQMALPICLVSIPDELQIAMYHSLVEEQEKT